MQPAEFFPKVTPPSLKAADTAREFQLTLTKPRDRWRAWRI